MLQHDNPIHYLFVSKIQIVYQSYMVSNTKHLNQYTIHLFDKIRVKLIFDVVSLTEKKLKLTFVNK